MADEHVEIDEYIHVLKTIYALSAYDYLARI